MKTISLFVLEMEANQQATKLFAKAVYCTCSNDKYSCMSFTAISWVLQEVSTS